MLEASGKRVYSAREFQPLGRLPRPVSGRCSRGEGASIRTTGNGRHYPYEELENPCNCGGFVARRGGRRPCAGTRDGSGRSTRRDGSGESGSGRRRCGCSGRDAGGNSLDNSIRFHRVVETRWLLCDVQIHGVANGFAHGRMHIFAETGELIATASQSLILRLWD